MKNFFLISSPLQLLCATEAVYKFCTKNNKLVIVNRGTKNNYFQIQTILKIYNNVFDEIVLLNGESKSMTGWRKKFKEINLLTQHSRVENIFIGDYQDGLSRHFSNKLKSANTYLLDDGFATLLINQKLNNGSISNNKDYLKYLISGFKYSYKVKNEIKFFTFFEHDMIRESIQHSFEILTNERTLVFFDDELYFLGSPVVEDGILSESKYLGLVHDYLLSSNCTNKYYLPHRREKKNKIKKIIDKTGVETLCVNLPVEIYLLKNKIEPSVVTSLFSTALYTLSKILKQSKIDVIKINPSDLLDRKQHVMNIYEVLENIE